jgi:hypothetical protein
VPQAHHAANFAAGKRAPPPSVAERVAKKKYTVENNGSAVATNARAWAVS